MSESVTSNADRSAATRELLLDSAITAIVKHGYSGATSVRISEISGLTRGAQVHHFGNKASLMVEALLHLHSRRLAIAESSHTLRGVHARDPYEEVVDTLWRSFDDDMWIATAELWTAARTDPELRGPLVEADRIISLRIRATYISSPMFRGISAERVTAMVGVLYATMRGMVMHELLDRSDKRTRKQRAELASALRLWVTDAHESSG